MDSRRTEHLHAFRSGSVHCPLGNEQAVGCPLVNARLDDVQVLTMWVLIEQTQDC